MADADKTLYIIAGPNGAGKTTASFTILPEILGVKEFVNADEIARGLSPFQPERVSVEAGRLMLGRIHHLLQRGENFAFETTLASRSYAPKIREAKEGGYTAVLFFFWLNSPALAKARVAARVREGGHNIEPAVIERRYRNGIRNLFDLYLPLVDSAFIYDNSFGTHKRIAEKNVSSRLNVIDAEKFKALQNGYGND